MAFGLASRSSRTGAERQGVAERVLLDASALLAYLHREPGFEVVRAALREGAAIGAVNLAEVLPFDEVTAAPGDAGADRRPGLGRAGSVTRPLVLAQTAKLYLYNPSRALYSA